MFATPYPSRNHPHARPGAMYQQVGLETKLSGANPHQLVAMLFDGFMEAVAQARGAMQQQNAALKGQAIGRAVRILDEGLRAGLDLQAGGSLARDLNELYGYLAMRLTVANLRSDDAPLAECLRLMKPLREAWLEIAPKTAR